MKPLGKLNQTLLTKGGFETTWRKASQERWVQSRVSENSSDGDQMDAGREEPDGTLIAINMMV